MLSVAVGDQFEVLLRQDIDPGWHTYWKNPGDSGAPPDISWQAPAGVTIGELAYPYPERIPYGPLMNFGYHDQVLMPFTVAVDDDFDAQSVELQGEGRVLVCADICIPQKVSVSLSIPVGVSIPNQQSRQLFNRASTLIPTPINIVSSLEMVGAQIKLNLGLPGVQDDRLSNVDYFPFEPELIDNPAEQRHQMTVEGLSLMLVPGYAFDATDADFSGVVVVTESVGDGLTSSFQFTTSQGLAASSPITNRDGMSLWLAVLFAFIGGIILNLMPCVFPVLSIKVLSLVESVHVDGSSIKWHGLAYGAGVVLSFVGIAALLIALRSSGAAIGWGFQLQSPVVVALLAYLFLVIGLNLMGLFEFNLSFLSVGDEPQNEGYLSSVSTGVLATVVAAPCTAPFMGAAVGFALLQSSYTGVIVFAALGAGMAMPYVLLCYSPGLLGRLPKPGNWMLVLKQVLAFPMFASAIWLVWVLGIQSGPTAMMQVMAGGLSLAFAVWLLPFATSGGSGSRLFARVLGIGLLILAIYVAVQQTAVIRSNITGGVEIEEGAAPYSQENLDQALLSGPVFVNFTAAWCITCKVNELNALDRPAVKSAFEKKGITYLKADWTNEDPEITAALQVHGRSGVPLYLLYANKSERPEILPQLLTETIVLNALDEL